MSESLNWQRSSGTRSRGRAGHDELIKFVGSFYSAIEEVIGALHWEGVTTIQPPDKERLADGREQLSFGE
jgi:hypothetical protein